MKKNLRFVLIDFYFQTFYQRVHGLSRVHYPAHHQATLNSRYYFEGHHRWVQVGRKLTGSNPFFKEVGKLLLASPHNRSHLFFNDRIVIIGFDSRVENRATTWYIRINRVFIEI